MLDSKPFSPFPYTYFCLQLPQQDGMVPLCQKLQISPVGATRTHSLCSQKEVISQNHIALPEAKLKGIQELSKKTWKCSATALLITVHRKGRLETV